QDFEGKDDSGVSWSQMSDRLDKELSQSDDDIEEFDQNIRTQFKNYSIPVSDKDWIKLKNDLNIAEARKEKIIISKAIEIATILLLIITISKYKTLTTVPVDLNPTFFATLIEDDTNAEIPLEQEIIISSTQEYVHNVLNQKGTTFGNSIFGNTNRTNKASSRYDISKYAITQKFQLTQRSLSPIANSLISINQIHPLPIRPFKTRIEMPDTPIIDVLLSLDSETNSIKDGWTMGIPISSDINFINSNFNVSYLRTQLNNDLSGKSIGLTASYRKGALEIETGARYSAKRFAPGLVSYTPASNKSFLLDELDEAKIKQLQIPLIAKVYASPNRNISFYGMAGIAVNVILDMDYTISKSIQANARPSSLPHVDALDLKNLPEGFMQGGDINDNLYMTALVGFGVQYHLSNKIGMYLQPQYQHTLTKNINDVSSKINSLNLEAGLKYKF
ncbi:MAG: opacity protein-like surface antigen, partial [Saprospiraceae bacterium]